MLERDYEVWPSWSRSGLLGGSVSLKMVLGVSKVQARLSVSLLLMPANPDTELSATSPAPCLPTCHDNGPNSEL